MCLVSPLTESFLLEGKASKSLLDLLIWIDSWGWLLGSRRKLFSRSLVCKSILSAICSPNEWVKEEPGLCGHLEGQRGGGLGLWRGPPKLWIRVSPGYISDSQCDLKRVTRSVPTCSSQERHKGCNAALTYALRLHLHCRHRGNASVALTRPLQTLVATQLQHHGAPCGWISLVGQAMRWWRPHRHRHRKRKKTGGFLWRKENWMNSC